MSKDVPPQESAHTHDIAGGATDQGPVRDSNQDAFWIAEADSPVALGALYVVADGVGGQTHGAVASQLVVDTVQRTFYELRGQGEAIAAALESAVLKANEVVMAEAEARGGQRMGSTTVVAVIASDTLYIAHVGDARAYLFRGGHIRQLTRDDTWVQKQVEAGLITPEEAAQHEFRNVVTQVLGNKPEITVHMRQEQLQTGDIVLLCSDGLYDVLPAERLEQFLLTVPADIAAQRLVDAAVEAEAGDNITAVVVQHGQPPPPPPAEPAPATVLAPKQKSRIPTWLLILAVVAVLIMIAVPAWFLLSNNDPDAAASAGNITLPASTTEAIDPADAGVPTALPAPTDSALAVAPGAATSTLVPTPTTTPAAAPLPSATPEPRGCVVQGVLPLLRSETQVGGTQCAITSEVLEAGQEVIILSEAPRVACEDLAFVNVRTLEDEPKEGWVLAETVETLAPGATCNP